MKISNLTETMKHEKPLGKLVSSCLLTVRWVFYVSLASCLLLFIAVAPRPVLAQTIPTVSFSPVPAVIDTGVGSTTVVDVIISNAVNIGGFDIHINYDPAVVRISQRAFGDFLPCDLQILVVDIPGSLRLGCVKKGTLGNNGSGTLVKLTFEAMAWGGSSPLSISRADLTEAENAYLVDVIVEPGELRVIPYHIALPLILKQGSEQSLLIPAETFAQAKVLQAGYEFFLALPACAEAQS